MFFLSLLIPSLSLLQSAPIIFISLFSVEVPSLFLPLVVPLPNSAHASQCKEQLWITLDNIIGYLDDHPGLTRFFDQVESNSKQLTLAVTEHRPTHPQTDHSRT